MGARTAWKRGRRTTTIPPETKQRDPARSSLEAETFEHFLHTRFVGQKRFSLEGGESLIIALNALARKLPAARACEELCMGMAHRGRLSVINEFLQKSLKVIFAEFSENFVPDLVYGDGDVKYHLGYIATRKLESGEEIGVRLTSNPSHLEAVNPVVEGMARARQRVRNDTEERAEGAAGAHPRRCGIRGAGRRCGDAEYVAVARLSHRGHGPHHRQ